MFKNTFLFAVKFMWNILYGVLECLCALRFQMRPLKHTEIHVVNTSSLLDKLISIVKPLLGSRIKQHVRKMCKYDI